MARHIFHDPRDRTALLAALADAPEHVVLHPWSTDPAIEAANIALLVQLGASLSRLPVVVDEDDPVPVTIEPWEDRAYVGPAFVQDQGEVWSNTLPPETPNVWRPGTLNSGWVRFVEDGVEEPWVADRQYLKGIVTTGYGRRWLALVDEFSQAGREPWNPVMHAVWDDIGPVDGGQPGIEAWAPGTNYLAGGEERSHGDEEWLNRRANNTQQLAPGTAGSGWMRTSNRPAPWYNLGNEGYLAEWAGTPLRVTHNGRLWRNPMDGTFWEPGVAVWIDEGPA